MNVKFDGLNVYLPDDVRGQVEAVAKERGVTPQELLDETIEDTQPSIWAIEIAIEAGGILERGEGWPTDPLRALLVGAHYAFILAEADDNATGRWRNNPRYIGLERSTSRR